jgi:hypothetical protein
MRFSTKTNVLNGGITVDIFLASSFGTVLVTLFQDLFSRPSWQSFTYLAYGWSLAWGRQTITTYLWLSGASRAKHFWRYYAFLGGALYKSRDRLWARVIRTGASFIPEDEVITVCIDDHTAKKSGRHIEGRDRYRNGAGSARQEYRVLEGINLVLGIMRIPLKRWPGHHLSVPIGLELYLKEKLARRLRLPYRSRSQLARGMVDLVAATLPKRHIRVEGDGEFATQAFLQDLPPRVDAVGRFLITSKLYKPLPKLVKRGLGRPRKKGDLIGSAKTLAQRPTGWQPHPTEAGALVQSWCGIWHSVLPGRIIRVVVVRRPHLENRPKAKGKRAFGRQKPLEAFFSTDVSLSPQHILNAYQERWAIEIDIREQRAFNGLAQDQCRKLTHIVGANTFRLLMAAARTLWFITQSERSGPLELGRFRPWYVKKVAPSQLDVVWCCREALHEAGIFPIPRFFPYLAKNQQVIDSALQPAA